jgi:hypothetical protein
MIEWLILLLLFPALVAAVVCLWGFAGCNQVFGLDPTHLIVSPPVNFAVASIGVNTIRLTWTGADTDVTYQVERTKEGGAPEDPRDVGIVSSIDDVNLDVGTKYFYRVRAVRGSDGQASDWTSQENATTWIFDGKLDPALGAGSDQANLEGSCIVTRIPAMTPPPNAPGTWPKIIITLRGSTIGPLTIDNFTISLPADLNPALPPDQREPWDSLAVPQVIATGIALAANTTQPFPVNFLVDGTKDLLIAFDINPTPGQGNGRFGPLILTPPPRSYFKLPNPPVTGPPIVEAGIQNRTSDLLPSKVHYLVEKIEVGEGP